MKVIGAGLPRTATLTQKVALEMLGFGPCYHMVNVLSDLEQVPLWRQALNGEAPWEQIFGGFESMVDWPGSFFYAELMQVYPDAKVLLSVRDAAAWERSMRETIWGVLYGDILIRHLSSAQAQVDPGWDSYISMMREMWQQSGLMTGQNSHVDLTAGAFDRYNEEVKQTVPSDRLLVWAPADGWEPLCHFLGVPVPDAPLPHVNDAKMFNDRLIDSSLAAIQQWRGQTAEAPAAAH